MKIVFALALTVALMVDAKASIAQKMKYNNYEAGFLPENNGFLEDDAPCCAKRVRECKVCIMNGNYGCERELPYCNTERGGYVGNEKDCEKNHCDQDKRIVHVRVPQFTLTPSEDVFENSYTGR
eukprot:CAMPEP_0175127760 /NCGR_PEP_ID=MMETSP0087-20121206/4560_1 /TAXON_ID=136419 /ORGANISM="Unknown Unknown, Strain D1" /LENGTH=123 /DNA_ID=CAMNT_0016409763 /DNA_START=95 /DNA_END=466 /DNA_ORIENTATION=+